VNKPTHILAALLLISGAGVAAAQARPATPIRVSLVGDRLAFATVADYRRVVDQPTEATRAQWARTLAAQRGFVSLAQRQPSPGRGGAGSRAGLVRDEYFAGILNPAGVVQIGEWIIRVDAAAEKVYALAVANAGEYRDLVAGNTRNAHVQQFTTGDDVLELLASRQHGGQKSLFCNQSGIGGRHMSIPVGGMNAYADFDRYGIYFTLWASMSPYGSSPFPNTFEFTGGIPANQGYVYYHVRCGSTASYATATKGAWKLTYQRVQSYQGSTNLNQVYFYYRLKDAQSAYLTPWLGFRVNK